MNDIEVVKVERDIGHKRGWAAGRWLYRQDGTKLTLMGKRLLAIVAGGFVLSSVWVLVRGPTLMELRSPVVFNGVVSTASEIEVPPAATASSATPKAKSSGGGHVAQKYLGLEVVSRPRLGQIPPGTTVRGKLVMGASNGMVKATLLETLTVNGEGVADTGTILIGTGSSTEERLLVDFTKMVFSDGTVQNVKGQACDQGDQTIGLKGSKVGKHASMLLAGIGLNFAAGLADGLQESETQGNVAVKKSDLRNASLNGAAKASIEESKDIMEKWKQQKTVITVPKGTEICIVFNGE